MLPAAAYCVPIATYCFLPAIDCLLLNAYYICFPVAACYLLVVASCALLTGCLSTYVTIDLVVYCNENGRIIRPPLPLNYNMARFANSSFLGTLVGPVVFARRTDGQLISLTDTDLRELRQALSSSRVHAPAA